MKNRRKNLSRRDDVINAAIRLFSEKDYHSVGMRELSREVGIHPSTIYHYFKSKDEIYRKVLDRIFDSMAEAITSAVKESAALESLLGNFVETIFDFMDSHPAYMKIVLREVLLGGSNVTPVVKRRAAHIYQKMLSIYETYRKRGVMRDVDPRQVMLSIMGMAVISFIGMPIYGTLWGVDPAHIKAKNERKKAIIDIILKGILPDKSEN